MGMTQAAESCDFAKITGVGEERRGQTCLEIKGCSSVEGSRGRPQAWHLCDSSATFLLCFRCSDRAFTLCSFVTLCDLRSSIWRLARLGSSCCSACRHTIMCNHSFILDLFLSLGWSRLNAYKVQLQPKQVCPAHTHDACAGQNCCWVGTYKLQLLHKLRCFGLEESQLCMQPLPRYKAKVNMLACSTELSPAQRLPDTTCAMVLASEGMKANCLFVLM